MNVFHKTHIQIPVFDQLFELAHGKNIIQKGLVDNEPPRREIRLLRDYHGPAFYRKSTARC